MWIKVNVDESVFVELVGREWVKRAFDIEFIRMNKTKQLLYETLLQKS